MSKEILENLVLYNPVNKKTRLGREKDGGYVIVDGYDYDYFISGGIGGDISFEIAFLKKYSNIKGLIFDGTVKQPINLPEAIKFIEKNIGFENSETLTNLTEYIKNYKNVFVKMDIEKSEWNLFRSPFVNLLPNIKQIVFEAHYTFTTQGVLESLKNLNKTHYLVHVHENNNGIMRNIENVMYPDLLELTFIRKDCKINGFNKNNLPVKDLDYPNVNKIEHNMNMWPFIFKYE